MSKTIVLADDQQDIRRLIRITLGYGDFNILEAKDAPLALHLIKEHRVDLAILDIFMPGPFNGLELCHQIKAYQVTPAVPIILLSGENSTSTRDAAKQAYCDIFMTKPFLPLRLIEAVERLLAPIASV